MAQTAIGTGRAKHILGFFQIPIEFLGFLHFAYTLVLQDLMANFKDATVGKRRGVLNPFAVDIGTVHQN